MGKKFLFENLIELYIVRLVSSFGTQSFDEFTTDKSNSDREYLQSENDKIKSVRELISFLPNLWNLKGQEDSLKAMSGNISYQELL